MPSPPESPAQSQGNWPGGGRLVGDAAGGGGLELRFMGSNTDVLQGDLLTGCRFEIEAYNRLVSSEDRREGVRAFNEKRAPDFKGR